MEHHSKLFIVAEILYTISFAAVVGPETPIIYGPSFAEMGHYAVFNCSTVSVPTSNFSWWFNGSLLANTAVFTADHLSLNMSGEYTCIAYNYVTGKNSTNSTILTVISKKT